MCIKKLEKNGKIFFYQCKQNYMKIKSTLYCTKNSYTYYLRQNLGFTSGIHYVCDQRVHLHSQSVQVNYRLSICMRKPTIWVSDQVRHKPGCRAEEDRNFRFRKNRQMYFLWSENKGADKRLITCSNCTAVPLFLRLCFRIYRMLVL